MDNNWKEMESFLRINQGKIIVAPSFQFFKENGCVPYDDFDMDSDFDFFVIHKAGFNLIAHQWLSHLIEHYDLTWTNNIFHVFGRRRALEPISNDKRRVSNRLKRILKEPLIERPLVFVHIEKCAGRSLYHAVRRHYSRQAYLKKPWLDCLLIKPNQNNFIAGHLSVYEYQNLLGRQRSPQWITIIRNPKERILSFVAHARRRKNQNDPMLTTLRENKLPQLENTEIWFKVCTASVSMLSCLPPTGLASDSIDDYYDSAIDFLHNKDVMFGIHDYFDDYINYLSKELQLNLDLEKRNVGMNYHQITDEEKEFMASYESPFLKKEEELYQTAVKLFHQRTETTS